MSSAGKRRLTREWLGLKSRGRPKAIGQAQATDHDNQLGSLALPPPRYLLLEPGSILDMRIPLSHPCLTGLSRMLWETLWKEVLETICCQDLSWPYGSWMQGASDPYEDQAALDNLPESLRKIIATAITQGIASGLRQHKGPAHASRGARESTRPHHPSQRAHSRDEQRPISPSLASEASIVGEDVQ